MPTPRSETWTSTGELGRVGGLTWTYTGIDRGDLFHIYWIVCDDPAEPCGLSLDGPIADVLPELAAPQVLEGFDASDEPKLRPATRPITLRHLITHTAGFVYDIWCPEMGRYMEKTGTPGIISCQNAALMLPLVFEPGEKWDYGIGIDWVGKAVERSSGQTLGDYFEEHIYGPIGMRDTGFILTPDRRARLVDVELRVPGLLAALVGELEGDAPRVEPSVVFKHKEVLEDRYAFPLLADGSALERCGGTARRRR